MSEGAIDVELVVGNAETNESCGSSDGQIFVFLGTGLVVFGFWTLDAFKQNGIGDFITLRIV